MNPLNSFFKLGDKITKGDVKRKADWDWYMLWVMFIAFFTIFIDRIRSFFITQSFSSLGWSFVMLAILWFQYNNLKGMYEMRKAFFSKSVKCEVNEGEMMKEFEE